MKTIIHTASSRGHANHGWLKSYHSFSFAHYFDPERMGFGALRVLNDDVVEGGMGFGEHPHKNMEIISIPLAGHLRHGDNMGNSGVIDANHIQIMSAGTGVVHSELNASATEPVKFLQIWVVPKRQGVPPRYDEIELKIHQQPNQFQQLVSPYKDDEGSWIHQKAWFKMGVFDSGQQKNYTLHSAKNGLYVFVIEGQLKIGDKVLAARDAMGIWETNEVSFESLSTAKVLAIEVPMQ